MTGEHFLNDQSNELAVRVIEPNYILEKPGKLQREGRKARLTTGIRVIQALMEKGSTSTTMPEHRLELALGEQLPD